MSYQEPDDQDELETQEVDAISDDELICVMPWQAPYSWDIVRGVVDVPNSVHEACCRWWVRQFSTAEENEK